MKVDILGVKVDQVNMAQSVEQVEQWLASQGRTLQGRYVLPKVKGKVLQAQSKIFQIEARASFYIVTPNVEFVMAAQQDSEFKKILNQADLAIPDSARFGWAYNQLQEENWFLKLVKWPLFLFPQLFHFDVVTGTDLMGELIKKASDKGLTVGFLGGKNGVAVKLKERLQKKYPKLRVVFASSGGVVDKDGELYLARGPVGLHPHSMSSPLTIAQGAGTQWGSPAPATPRKENSLLSLTSSDFAPSLKIPPTDLLFIAFGQVKQEKWIANNLHKQPVKVMMGVGGGFDYLSGLIPRAPMLIRALGLEWLFRLLIQPWRIKRFSALAKFVFLMLLSK